jgi:hypothetical protein
LIDVNRSIKEQKLIHKESIIEVLAKSIFYFILTGIYPYFAIINLLISDKQGEDLTSSYIILGVTILVSGYIIFSILSFSKLKRVKGKDLNSNRKLILSIIKERGFKKNKDNNQLTIAIYHDGLLRNWGRKFVFIYDNEYILLNCTTLGVLGIQSPFHGISNRNQVNKMIKIIKEKLPPTTKFSLRPHDVQ